MAKYSAAIRDKIIELYATGNHTIEQISKHVGINQDTFFDWKKNKPEFSEALKGVEVRRLANLGELALSGLAVLLTKHEYEEITTEYVEGKDQQPKIKSQKKVKKFVMPNPTAVIFALSNRDPEHWKTKQSNELLDKNGDVVNPVVTVVMAQQPLARSEKDVDV